MASLEQSRDQREEQRNLLSSQNLPRAGSSSTIKNPPHETTVAPSDTDSVHATSSLKAPIHGAARNESQNLHCADSRVSAAEAVASGWKAASEDSTGSSPAVHGQGTPLAQLPSCDRSFLRPDAPCPAVHGQPPKNLGLSKRKRYRDATRDLLAQLEMKTRKSVASSIAIHSTDYS